MKKKSLLILFITLWLLASSREFYLNYSILKIKEYQQKWISELKETSRLKTILVDINDPLLQLEGDKELYYKDTLYDIVWSEKIASTKIKYLLLSDFHEQSLLFVLFEKNKSHRTENYAISFYYKFIAVQSGCENLLKAVVPTDFSNPYPGDEAYVFTGYVSGLLQPPD